MGQCQSISISGEIESNDIVDENNNKIDQIKEENFMKLFRESEIKNQDEKQQQSSDEKKQQKILEFGSFKESEHKIVKIQAHLRGNLSRNQHEKNQQSNQEIEKMFKKYQEQSLQAKKQEDQQQINNTLNQQKKTKLPAIELLNNTIYEGQWMNGLKHGKGILRFGENLYDGEWENNQVNGVGKLIYTDVGQQQEVYDGQWKQDKACGKGTYHNEFFKYEGEWLDDDFSGQGVLEIFGYSLYKGQFLNGIKHGKGTQKFLQINSVFEGEFKFDQLNGKGVYTQNENKYVGEWKDNKMNGFFEITWKNESKFKGNYVDDVKNGEGVIEWKDGRSLKGNFIEGLLEGDCEYKQSNGESKKGVWLRGKRIRWNE